MTRPPRTSPPGAADELAAAFGALDGAHALQERARRRRVAARHLDDGPIADQLQTLGLDPTAAAESLRLSARELDRRAANARDHAKRLGKAAGHPFDDDELDPVPF